MNIVDQANELGLSRLAEWVQVSALWYLHCLRPFCSNHTSSVRLRKLQDTLVPLRAVPNLCLCTCRLSYMDPLQIRSQHRHHST